MNLPEARRQAGRAVWVLAFLAVLWLLSVLVERYDLLHGLGELPE